MTTMNYFIKNFFKKLAVMKTLPIFAPELPLERSIQVLMKAVFFIPANQTVQGCCIPSDSRFIALLTVPKQGIQQSFFIFKKFIIRQMERSIKNESSVNNSNLLSTSADETCEKFITFICERYPQLNRIKYKISKNGKYLCLRAQYKRRAIHAEGRDFEKTMSCFYFYLLLKLSIDRYYPTLTEMREKRPLEEFFIKLQCEVSQMININA